MPVMNSQIQKVCIVGNTASGKSFFSRLVGEALKLPVYHLDQVYWRGDWTHISRTDFLVRQEELITCPLWVIDGCFSEFGLSKRFQSADAIIFIDQPVLTCAKRAISRRGDTRKDLPTGADDKKMSLRTSLAFLAEILLFGLIDRPRIMRAAHNTDTLFIIIKQWAEEEDALKQLVLGHS